MKRAYHSAVRKESDQTTSRAAGHVAQGFFQSLAKAAKAGAASLMPPQLNYYGIAQPNDADKATIDAAVEWGKTAGPDEGAVRSLQAQLGTLPTGTYNHWTASLVLAKQKKLKLTENAKADEELFRKMGLIYTGKVGDLTIDEEVKQQILDATGEFKAEFRNGFSLGFYTEYDNQSNNNKEFLRQAAPWAKRHQALGIKDGKLTVGEPIAIKRTGAMVENIIQIAKAVDGLWKNTILGKYDSIFENIGKSLGMSDENKPSALAQLAKPKIKNLGIFTHGMTYGLGLNSDKTNSYKHGLLAYDYKKGAKANVDDFASRIKAHLGGSARVQLFACNAGREYDAKDYLKKAAYKHWQTGTKGGDNSFAAKLSEALGDDTSVYAHLTAGHTTRNIAAVVFGKDAGADNGTHIFSLLYPSSFVEEQLNELFPDLPKEQRDAARKILVTAMSKHYKGTKQYKGVTAKKIEVPDSDRDTNVGSEMFTNPESAKQIIHKDWKDSYVKSSYFKTYKKKIQALIPKE